MPYIYIKFKSLWAFALQKIYKLSVAPAFHILNHVILEKGINEKAFPKCVRTSISQREEPSPGGGPYPLFKKLLLKEKQTLN